MAVSRGMRSLLRVRAIQEEQSQAALDEALGELNRLEVALKLARRREHAGRRLVAASAATGNLTDRMAGLEETRTAQRFASALKPRIAEAQEAVRERRSQFLEKRIERRQAETMIQQRERSDELEAARRAQRGVDDWFLGRLRRSRDAGRNNQS